MERPKTSHDGHTLPSAGPGPGVGLALGGGAARGLAHIVYRELQDLTGVLTFDVGPLAEMGAEYRVAVDVSNRADIWGRLARAGRVAYRQVRGHDRLASCVQGHDFSSGQRAWSTRSTLAHAFEISEARAHWANDGTEGTENPPLASSRSQPLSWPPVPRGGRAHRSRAASGSPCLAAPAAGERRLRPLARRERRRTGWGNGGGCRCASRSSVTPSARTWAASPEL